jgi:hypothetical protein
MPQDRDTMKPVLEWSHLALVSRGSICVFVIWVGKHERELEGPRLNGASLFVRGDARCPEMIVG